ncbi:DMT family transporter [Frankia sp. Cr1]|uniref:DMT family transporter n=1 Tax=Frankia sp. Cr1 TaxID=3073931 RepID=UPI002AD33701|nr:EamA family transporter [Frankia sp. Cr1]
MNRRGWFLFALMCIIWGIPYLLIKVAVESVSVPVLVFTRTAVGAAVLLPLALRGGQLVVLVRHWRPLTAFAAIEIIFPWFLLSNAERHITSSMAGLIIAAVPILAVVMARLIGDSDQLNARRWAGLALGFAGVTVLVGPNLGVDDPWAIIEVLLTACGYAGAPLLTAHRLKGVPGLPMAAVCLAGTALLYTPAAVLTWPDSLPPGRVLAALAGLAVVCTALGFVVFFALIREVGPSRAMVFTYVNPAIAVTAGVCILGEPLRPTFLAAFVLILVGSVLATARQSIGEPVPEPAVPQAAVPR